MIFSLILYESFIINFINGITQRPRQNIEIPVIEESALIVFEEAAFKKAISKCTLMRKKGINVEMILKDTEKSKEDYAAYAVSNHINKVEFIEE